jgi:hypothetical protein
MIVRYLSLREMIDSIPFLLFFLFWENPSFGRPSFRSNVHIQAKQK